MTREELEEIKRERAMAVRATAMGLAIALSGGAIALFIALRDGKASELGVGALIVLTGLAVGGVLGFLFAVPRVLSEGGAQSQLASVATTGSATAIASGAGGASEPGRIGIRLLRSNTNLERISDWLTTMLVGVGLSQIGRIGEGLDGFSDFIRQGCVPAKQDAICSSTLPMIGPFLLVFGLVSGFLYFYLYTRLAIVTQLNDVERVIDGSAELAQTKITDQDGRQALLDAAATLQDESENPTVRMIAATGQPSVQESLTVMNKLLYQNRGYQQVIELGGKLVQSPASKSASYWVLMAAAFGQKMTALKAEKGESDSLRSARDNVLDCARRAVAIDPTTKEWLWRLTDPSGMDNDLQDLRDDPEFKNIVGR